MTAGNAKYTPGPLAIWGKQAKTEIGGFTVIGKADQTGGCTAYVCGTHDAQLYAAAPDLVEALKGVMPALRDAADTMTAHGRKASASELEANIRIARAALSKAGV